MFNFFIISGSSLCCVLKALRKAFWRAYISIIAFCWLLDSFADKIKMHRKQWVFSTVYLKDLKIRRVPEFLLYVYVFCIFWLVWWLNKKEDRASCPLPQNWPNQNKCNCSEEIRLDAELEAAINDFHFIYFAANIKFVQSKMLIFFFFQNGKILSGDLTPCPRLWRKFSSLCYLNIK